MRQGSRFETSLLGYKSKPCLGMGGERKGRE